LLGNRTWNARIGTLAAPILAYLLGSAPKLLAAALKLVATPLERVAAAAQVG
jgi:hypothetical protein